MSLNKFTPNGQNIEINRTNFSNSQSIQNFVNKQLFTVGTQFVTNAGGKVQKDIAIKNAKFLIGLNVYSFDPTNDFVSMEINRETVIEKTAATFLMPSQNFKVIQYFEFIRPVTNGDTISLSVESANASQFTAALYFINDFNPHYIKI